MSNLYSLGNPDPFAGQYHDGASVFASPGSTSRHVSGLAMALGMMVVWSSIFAPAIVAGLLRIDSIATAEAWPPLPEDAPALGISVLVLALTAIVGVVAATLGRHKLRRKATAAGLVRVAIGAIVLVAGVWWALTVNGIPL